MFGLVVTTEAHLAFSGARMSTVHDFRSTQTSAHHATRVRSQWKSGADHAAALGTSGLSSNHNIATRWIHHNFDASACFDGCNNITDVLERLQRIRQMQRHFPRTGISIVFIIGFFVFFVLPTCFSGRFVHSCSQPFPFGLLFLRTSDEQPFFIRLYRTEF